MDDIYRFMMFNDDIRIIRFEEIGSSKLIGAVVAMSFVIEALFMYWLVLMGSPKRMSTSTPDNSMVPSVIISSIVRSDKSSSNFTARVLNRFCLARMG